MAGREAHAWRGHSSQRVLRQALPDTSRSILAQVPPMPRSNRAQRGTARAHDHTTVRVRMLRRGVVYMEVHRALGGLIHDPALLQAVALGYEGYEVLLVASANRTSVGSAAAA